jgi:hypothetical protein
MLLALRERLDAVRTGPLRHRVVASAGAPRLAAELRRTLRRLPAQELVFDDSPSGRGLRDAVSHGVGRWRCVRPLLAVIRLPEDRATYLRGRHRQALRTNLTKADRLGLAGSEVPGKRQMERLAEQVRAARYDTEATAEEFPYEDTDRWFAVRTADDRCVALAGVAVGARDAYLRVLLSAGTRDEAGAARYLAHTMVVHAMMDSGASRLWADGPLTVSPGLQHFQRLLGYECVRPVLTPAHNQRGGSG